VIVAVLGALVTLACVLLGRRRPGAAASAAWFGVAVGIIYAATAARLKTVTDIAVRDHFRLVAASQLYAVILVGIAGVLLNQLAFQAGPITASLPAIATIDPLLSIVIGVVVYDEQLRRGPGGGALLLILLLVLSTAVVALTRTVDPQTAATPAS
jgi:hypothetical protein